MIQLNTPVSGGNTGGDVAGRKVGGQCVENTHFRMYMKQ